MARFVLVVLRARHAVPLKNEAKAKFKSAGRRPAVHKANCRSLSALGMTIVERRRYKTRKASGHPGRTSVGRDLSYVSG